MRTRKCFCKVGLSIDGGDPNTPLSISTTSRVVVGSHPLPLEGQWPFTLPQHCWYSFYRPQREERLSLLFYQASALPIELSRPLMPLWWTVETFHSVKCSKWCTYHLPITRPVAVLMLVMLGVRLSSAVKVMPPPSALVLSCSNNTA